VATIVIFILFLVDGRVLTGHSGSYGGFPTCRAGGTSPYILWDRRVELAYLGIVLPSGSISLDGCRPYLVRLNKLLDEEKKIFTSEIKHTKHRSPPPCLYEPLT